MVGTDRRAVRPVHIAAPMRFDHLARFTEQPITASLFSCQAARIFAMLLVYENDNSRITTFDEPRALPARFAAHCTRSRLFRPFATSASGLSRWLLNELQHRSR